MLRFSYINEIKKILENARNITYTVANTEMIKAYWLIGHRIVEEEQNGKERATYGKEIIKNVSKELTESFGRGFSERTIREYRQFYSRFPDLLIHEDEEENIWRTAFAISVNPIWRTVFAKLHWSHYQRVLKTDDHQARSYYLSENKQIFANKYLPYLPTEEELAAEIERDKNVFMERRAKYGK